MRDTSGRNRFEALCLHPQALLLLAALGLLVSRIGSTYNSPILLYESAPLLIAVKLVKAVTLVLLGLWCSRVDFRGMRPLAGLAVLTLLVCVIGEVPAAFGAGNAGLYILTQVSSGVNEALVLFLYVVLAARASCGAAILCGVTALASAFALVVAAGPLVIPAWACLLLRCCGLVVLILPAMNLSLPESGQTLEGDLAHSRFSIAAFVLVCFAVNVIGGFFISLPNIGGFYIDNADWGVTQAVLVLSESMLAALLVWRPNLARHPLFLVPSLGWCLFALLLLPLDWPSAAVNLGIVAVYTGRNVFELCSWACALAFARARGREGLLVLGLVLAVSTLYVGTALALPLREAIASSRELFLYVGIVAAVVLAACLCVPFSLRPPRGNASSKEPSSPDSEAARALAQFDARLLALIDTLGLSERETAILVDAVHGYSADAIGERLGYSRDAVKFSMTKIYARAGVTGRQELLRSLEAQSVEK